MGIVAIPWSVVKATRVRQAGLKTRAPSMRVPVILREFRLLYYSPFPTKNLMPQASRGGSRTAPTAHDDRADWSNWIDLRINPLGSIGQCA